MTHVFFVASQRHPAFQPWGSTSSLSKGCPGPRTASCVCVAPNRDLPLGQVSSLPTFGSFLVLVACSRSVPTAAPHRWLPGLWLWGREASPPAVTVGPSRASHPGPLMPPKAPPRPRGAGPHPSLPPPFRRSRRNAFLRPFPSESRLPLAWWDGPVAASTAAGCLGGAHRPKLLRVPEKASLQPPAV